MSANLIADRLQLGVAAIISPSRAAELLPWGEGKAMAWLRSRGLVRNIRGMGDAVVWGDVVAAVQAGDEDPPQALPRHRGTLPRSSRV